MKNYQLIVDADKQDEFETDVAKMDKKIEKDIDGNDVEVILGKLISIGAIDSELILLETQEEKDEEAAKNDKDPKKKNTLEEVIAEYQKEVDKGKVCVLNEQQEDGSWITIKIS